jgi:hypothetical protein
VIFHKGTLTMLSVDIVSRECPHVPHVHMYVNDIYRHVHTHTQSSQADLQCSL